MINYIYYFIIAFLLVLATQSILTSSEFLMNFNFLLVVIVFITIIFGFNLGFIWAIFIGLFMSIYSYMPIGSYILIFLLIVFIIDFLYKNVLTNFSLYSSLILMIVATLIFNFVLVLLNYLLYFFGLISLYIVLDSSYWQSFIWQLILNIVIMTIIFLLSKATIKKLNLAFLIKK